MQQATQEVCPQAGGFAIKTGRKSTWTKRRTMLFTPHNLPLQVDRD
jgi:hypothetical protein